MWYSRACLRGPYDCAPDTSLPAGESNGEPSLLCPHIACMLSHQSNPLGPTGVWHRCLQGSPVGFPPCYVPELCMLAHHMLWWSLQVSPERLPRAMSLSLERRSCSGACTATRAQRRPTMPLRCTKRPWTGSGAARPGGFCCALSMLPAGKHSGRGWKQPKAAWPGPAAHLHAPCRYQMLSD